MAVKKKPAKKTTAKKASVKKPVAKKSPAKKAAAKKPAAKKTVAKKPSVKKAVAKKPAAKKAISKKPTVKKTVAKKPAAAKPTSPPKAITTVMNKIEVINTIAEMTDMNQKDVGAVFTAMKQLIEQHMMKRGSGEFTVPDAGVKIHKIRKGPSKKRNGHNPYSGEAMVIPAKKARFIARVSALKFLKDAVA
jgi:nucleoid DNA-binding protein